MFKLIFSQICLKSVIVLQILQYVALQDKLSFLGNNCLVGGLFYSCCDQVFALPSLYYSRESSSTDDVVIMCHEDVESVDSCSGI